MSLPTNRAERKRSTDDVEVATLAAAVVEDLLRGVAAAVQGLPHSDDSAGLEQIREVLHVPALVTLVVEARLVVSSLLSGAHAAHSNNGDD
jgi:hypothetical protein